MLLLIEPEAAKTYATAHPPYHPNPNASPTQPAGLSMGDTPGPMPPPTGASKAKSFHGNVSINASAAKMRLV